MAPPPDPAPPPAVPRPTRNPFRWGFLAGALFGTSLALLMDVQQGRSLGSGWREAAANDANRIFNAGVTPDHALAWLGAAVGILFMAGLGGLMAGAFASGMAAFLGAGRSDDA